MKIVVRYSSASLPAARYDSLRLFEEEFAAGDGPWEYHVCFGSDGNLLVDEIWDAHEAAEVLARQSKPQLDRAAIDSGEPAVSAAEQLRRT